MCLAKAYTKSQGSEPILENITYMELGGDHIQMETMFGQEKLLSGRVLEVDFENSKVIVELYNTSTGGDKP